MGFEVVELQDGKIDVAPVFLDLSAFSLENWYGLFVLAFKQ